MCSGWASERDRRRVQRWSALWFPRQLYPLPKRWSLRRRPLEELYSLKPWMEHKNLVSRRPTPRKTRKVFFSKYAPKKIYLPNQRITPGKKNNLCPALCSASGLTRRQLRAISSDPSATFVRLIGEKQSIEISTALRRGMFDLSARTPAARAFSSGRCSSPSLSSPLRKGFVGLVEVIGEGEDGENGRYQAGDARHEHEAVGQEGSYPQTEAKLAR